MMAISGGQSTSRVWQQLEKLGDVVRFQEAGYKESPRCGLVIRCVHSP